MDTPFLDLSHKFFGAINATKFISASYIRKNEFLDKKPTACRPFIRPWLRSADYSANRNKVNKLFL